jgi:hypothetical protein
VLVAKSAVLFDLHPVGVGFLVLGASVVALLALSAGENDLRPQNQHLALLA